ncbi:Fur family transcriptional regulator [Candidatus Viridilinea mediisalina]|uniref:Fur family transcriptional regulator n=1 Tax=Candidatus Viridilinea mediisalina TaxID=2024553 RepID=A0A2A6RGV8_9CHLR|nr:Fur family transcriptional regulator [Candidatus Viridilinea mediisalina]PDW02364.1 Fur family transcriptional regulator [Candidatus Viridilinea mediisalina]
MPTLYQLPATWSSQVQAAMRAEGQRITAPRLAIIAWIADQERPFSAEALTLALAKHPAGVGRATAYRAVEWLREHRWLARIQTDRGDYTYARTLPGHHHHAICTRCGTTLMLEGCGAIERLTQLLAREGFEVQGHLLELFGRCRRC